MVAWSLHNDALETSALWALVRCGSTLHVYFTFGSPSFDWLRPMDAVRRLAAFDCNQQLKEMKIYRMNFDFCIRMGLHADMKALKTRWHEILLVAQQVMQWRKNNRWIDIEPAQTGPRPRHLIDWSARQLLYCRHGLYLSVIHARGGGAGTTKLNTSKPDSTHLLISPQ